MGEFLIIADNMSEISKKLKSVIDKFPKQIDVAAKNAGNLIIAELKRKTPKQSGNTSRGYTNTRKALADYVISNKVKTTNGKFFVSDLLEDGTKKHSTNKSIVIKPKKPGGVLAFKVNGKTVFAKNAIIPKPLSWIDLGKRGNRALGTKGKKGTGKRVFAAFVKGIKALRIFAKTEDQAKEIVRKQFIGVLDRISRDINKPTKEFGAITKI